MKWRKACAGLMAIICMMSLVTSVFAAEARSSAQIAAYKMNVTSGAGTLATEFTVLGNGGMNKLGCQSIYVYRKTDTGWAYVTCRLEDYEGMSKTDSSYHTKVIYIGCTAGVQYKVVVTIFAENDAGRDARTEVFYLTGIGTAWTEP